jgi:hypothetical protein
MNKNTLNKFIDNMVKSLKGEWILIGGSLLYLLDISSRVTLDIDIVSVGESTNKDTLKLMEIAEKLSLPPEAINQAGALYLKKISGWKNNLVEIKSSSDCTIYRPNATLYVLLKLNRLSQADAEDIVAMLSFAKVKKEVIDIERLSKRVEKALSDPKINEIQGELLIKIKKSLY